MADGYVKILSSILDSSIWAEPDDAVRVWVTMLAMADRDGYVGAAPSGIAHRSRTVSVERVRELLEQFQSPDPESRTEDYEGRRIQKVDRGWLILNYKKIRDMHGEESKKAAKRRWWNEHRKGQAREHGSDGEQLEQESLEKSSEISSHGSVYGSDLSSLSSGSDAREAKESTSRPDPMRRAMEQPPDLAKELFDAWREESGKPGATLDGARRQLFLRLASEGVTVEHVRDATRGAKLDTWATNTAKLSPSAILGTAEQREKFVAILRDPPSKSAHRPPQPNNEAKRYPIRGL